MQKSFSTADDDKKKEIIGNHLSKKEIIAITQENIEELLMIFVI